MIYGASTILVRLINYVLTPIQTRVITDQAEFGIISVMFAYVAFLNVLFMYGMETAYFRYASQADDKNSIFKNSNTLLFISTSILVCLMILFSGAIASIIGYPNHKIVVCIFACILGFDTLVNIPFARLRLENKPFYYMGIKLLNVLINVGLNLFFLAPGYFNNPTMFAAIGFTYNPSYLVYYVFIANLAASSITFLCFLPAILRTGFAWNKTVINTLWKYGSPLIIVGLAGIVNEVIDRVMLKKYLSGSASQVDQKIGIYSACYKVAILMNLCVQAFRMGAEPFFFKQATHSDAKKTNADVMLVFSIFMLLMFLFISLFLNYFILIIGANFRSGAYIIPYLCIAYYLLGIFYNLSTWYKVTDKTKLAARVSIAGAITTIISTYILIPHFDILAGALGTIIGYASMCVLSYLLGQKHYPVPYARSRMLFYLVFALLLYYLYTTWVVSVVQSEIVRIALRVALLILFACIAYFADIRKRIKLPV